MRYDDEKFLRDVQAPLGPANPLRVPPDDALDTPAPVRRIMLAGRGLEAAYAAKCEECEQALRQAEAANAAYRKLSVESADRIARLEQELAARPHLLTARALRWLRLGQRLGLV